MRAIGLGITLCAALAVSACGSARLNTGTGARAAVRPAPVYNAPEEVEPAPAAPSGAVSSEPLPPPGGYGVANPGYPPPGGAGPIVADVPTMPSAPAPVELLRPTVEPPRQQIAVASPSRSAVVGGWTAREASGSCRLQLSSTPALDLYKASASGCVNRDLARVTAWDFRDGEVFLYQPGGAVAARLRPSGGAMDGVLAKSGAPLALSR
jgi:hypothetical protein